MGVRRAHGELVVPGVKAAASTVWEISHDAGIDPAPERSSATWAGFLRSPAGALPVLDQAVMREFCQLLDADAGGTQHLNGRPGPEPAVLFEGQVTAFPRAGVLGPGPAGRVGLHHRAAQRLPAAVNSAPAAACWAARSRRRWPRVRR
jgi:hypothetical protein